MSEFDEQLDKRLDIIGSEATHSANENPDWNRLSLDEGDPSFDDDFNQVINDDEIPDADEEVPEIGGDEKHSSSYDAFDPYLHMEVGLPRGQDDQLHYAKVKRRADTREYEVEFLDGSKEILHANIIAENLLA